MSRVRNFICTLNNPEKDAEQYLTELFATTKFKWVVGQLERGVEGTEHIQFAFAAKDKMSIRTAKTIVGDRVHLEITRDIPAAIEYVQKEDTRVSGPWRFGSIPLKGDKGESLSVKQARSLSRDEKDELPVYKYIQV